MSAPSPSPPAPPAAPPSASPSASPTLLLHLTGADRPGLTAAVLATLATRGVEVLDVEQLVVRGHLTLALLTTPGDDGAATAAGVRAVADDLGLALVSSPGAAEERRRGGRVHVTLLARPLSAAAVAAVAGAVAGTGANIDRIRRLSREPVTSLQLDVSGAEPEALRRVLAAEAAVQGVDVAVSPAGLARHGRRLVVMDVDSTLIRHEVIELLAAHAGREAEVAAVTERAMRGELDFAASLHERVAALAGLDAAVLERVRDAVQLTPGARTLCRVLHRLGFTLALVSGGFAEVVQPLAASLGIAHVRANRLEVVDGRLTGRVLGPVVDRAAKAVALREFAAAEGLPLSRTVAVGDGANDLDMLAAAGLGVAFNAKPVVREQAEVALTTPYLDSVLYLLGITREEVEEGLAEAGEDAPPA
ncbi:phosphoserine phosphatase SerB [Quadrisphaera sp. DSM 44207]|uniref:phosphoserine phosphatase SerB n=1 Tax=Quadrisphaera sp. DSM 44207 TaxID=1881057 RepID=UPI00088EB712|nr:phosphoserine phosphatase SerB [Quadrisphaera sp. DSM 44207]SDQ43368.1 phosphoserine phosphatase [Quadrisphaera sp. DSM 44207]